jgi:hypothetical protein
MYTKLEKEDKMSYQPLSVLLIKHRIWIYSSAWIEFKYTSRGLQSIWFWLQHYSHALCRKILRSDVQGGCGPPAWGLGVGLTTPHRKKKLVTKTSKEPRTWTDFLDK